MQVRLAKDVEYDSIVDGEGLRTVIWMQGCSHNCEGCHNKQTHSFSGGFSVPIESIIDKIDSSNNQDGITLSGGDPMFQIEQSLYIAKHAKEKGLNVWCYTGFTFERLHEMSFKNESLREFLNTIDVLIDGPFVLEKKNFSLKYRGSSNQRIIDVQKTLKKSKVMLKIIKDNNTYYQIKGSDFLFI